MALRDIPRPVDLDHPPGPLPPTQTIDLPESLNYRLKRKLLGKPLHTEELAHERLGNPTALAIFASDNLSSCAYASEEILRVLVPAVGVAAFSLVVPITVAMLVVLAFLILSYRQTIKEYPEASGAYVVTRDNFGPKVAIVAGVSLLTDYILTVAVSTAAGTAALVSVFEALAPYKVEIAIAFIVVIAYANLRGMRESGAIFRVPTYFFITMMGLLLLFGVGRMLFGDLPMADATAEGLERFGSPGDGLLQGASLFVVLHAFASGGAAVTGVEAISDGVPAFRPPEWRNARKTLTVMGLLLGVMFLGLSSLAGKMHVAPFEEGTPTVLSEVGRLTFGEGGIGPVLFVLLQAGTMLILVLAANTAFADFPRLASFQAADNFVPRQLLTRGHRLVFSNGILTLSGVAVLIVIGTGAKVERLIPLYAVGVFTSFSMSQAAMVKHHLRMRGEGWRGGLAINATGGTITAVVAVIFAVTKFRDGAWMVLVIVPILVVSLLRLRRHYEAEDRALQADAMEAATTPILRRHVVLVFVDKLDRATARAIQYARSLTPDELRAVHIAVDQQRAERLAEAWGALPLSRISLELVECPDRRVARSAVEVVARDLSDGSTEVTVLLPRRVYRRFWHKLLHDRTAEQIAETVGRLPHANVTSVPFNVPAPGDLVPPGPSSDPLSAR